MTPPLTTTLAAALFAAASGQTTPSPPPPACVAAGGLPGCASESMAAIRTQLTGKSSMYDTTERPSVAAARNTVHKDSGTCVDYAGVSAPPEQVKTQFYIDKMGIDQKGLSFTLEGYLRAWWNDPRLQFNSSCGVSSVVYTGMSSHIWVPDFYYEKAISVSLATSGRAEQLYVKPSGDVVWSRQSAVTISCPMYFGNLPFDSQTCTYMFGMYSQPMSEVNLTWLELSEQGSLKNFDQVGTATWSTGGVTPTNHQIDYGTTSYTYAKADLHLTRIDQSFVVSYVVLATLVVMMSYAGFYISPAAAPGRIALAVITVLVLNNLSNSAKGQLPPFAYNTWLTDFLFGSMLFNMWAFFSYASVNFGMQMAAQLKEIELKRKQAAEKAAAEGVQMVDVNPHEGSSAGLIITSMIGGKQSEVVVRQLAKLAKADHTMRWLFLLGYMIFLLAMVANIGNYVKTKQ